VYRRHFLQYNFVDPGGGAEFPTGAVPLAPPPPPLVPALSQGNIRSVRNVQISNLLSMSMGP